MFNGFEKTKKAEAKTRIVIVLTMKRLHKCLCMRLPIKRLRAPAVLTDHLVRVLFTGTSGVKQDTVEQSHAE